MFTDERILAVKITIHSKDYFPCNNNKKKIQSPISTFIWRIHSLKTPFPNCKSESLTFLVSSQWSMNRPISGRIRPANQNAGFGQPASHWMNKMTQSREWFPGWNRWIKTQLTAKEEVCVHAQKYSSLIFFFSF